MEKTLRAIIIVITGLFVLGCGGSGDSLDIKMMKNLEKAKQRSKEESKPLLVYFYQVENNACREFEGEVLVRNEVKLASKDVIWLEINGAVYPEAAQEFAVFALPTILFMTPGGEKELDRVVDVPETSDLVERINLIKQGKGKASQILEKEKENTQDLKAVYDAAVVWRDRGRMPDEAVPRFRFVFERDLDNKLGLGSKCLLQLAFADLFTRSRMYYSDAIKKLDKLIESYPASPEAPNAMLAKAGVLEALDKKDEALSTYDLIIAKYPTSEAAKQAEDRKGRITAFEETIRAFIE